MNPSTQRITSVFLCHPNSKIIAREVELALAHCGLLPVGPDVESSKAGVRLYSGTGMWHLMDVAPVDTLWALANSDGVTFLQLLGKQLLAPGFVGITADGGDQGEVFLELDAQGQVRASGQWNAETSFCGAELQQPIQPFSSGLKSLWASGQTQAAMDGLRDLSPVQAFLRMALHRLGGEQIAKTENWDTSLVYECAFAEAEPEAVAAFIEKVTAQINLERQSSQLRLNGEPMASSPSEQVEEAQAVSGDELAETSNFDDQDVTIAGSDVQTGEEVVEHLYRDGQVVQVGDALAMDDGLSSAKLHSLTPDGADRAGFVAHVEVAEARVQQQSGALFLARAKCLAKDVATYREAEQVVVDWIKARAAEQDVRAMLFLGIRLLQGAGVEKDPRQAYEHLVQAADNGSAMAQYLVGSMSKNPVRSVRYWSKAAEQGHAPSWFLLGVAQYKGQGVAQDHAQACSSFERAAHQGHLPAIYNLGVIKGGSTQVLLEDADAKFEQFERMASQGNVVAQWVVAQSLMRNGVEPHSSRVSHLLIQAAAQGFEPASGLLTQMLSAVEMTAGQRQVLFESITGAAATSPCIQRALGTALTQAEGKPAEMLQGVKWLVQASQGGARNAVEELNRVKIDLLAQVADLLSRIKASADTAVDEPNRDDVELTAQAMHRLVECEHVQLGPNALVQLQGLYQAAEQMGSSTAAASLERLKQAPSWAQAQLLEQISKPWANSELDGVGQLESLSTLPPETGEEPPSDAAELGGGREGNSAVLTNEQSDAQAAGASGLVSAGTVDTSPSQAEGVFIETVFAESDASHPMTAAVTSDAVEPVLAKQTLNKDAFDDAQAEDSLGPVAALDLNGLSLQSVDGADAQAMELAAALQDTASEEQDSAPVADDAAAKAEAERLARQREEEEQALQTRLRETLVLSREDEEYESNLSEADLEILGAFKNMPSFDVLETMIAAEEDADYENSLVSGSGYASTQTHSSTQGHPTTIPGAENPASILPHNPAAATEEEPPVFVSEGAEGKKKAWWKFW